MEVFAIFANQAAFDAFLLSANTTLGYPLPDGTANYTEAIVNDDPTDLRIAALVDSAIDQTPLTIQNRDYLLAEGWFQAEALEDLFNDVLKDQRFGAELIAQFSAEARYADLSLADNLALGATIKDVQIALLVGSIASARAILNALTPDPSGFLTAAVIAKYVALMDAYLAP